MIRFASLGSGSSGNGLVIEAARAGAVNRVLVDCGLTQRDLAARLARAGLGIADLDAIFVTHEHTDHVGSAVAVARRHRIPLCMSRGTWQAIGEPALPDGLLRHVRDGEPVTLGALTLSPFTVPHDAREPLQLTADDGERRLGVLTDAGIETDHLLENLQRCDALVLECNHDEEMLARSRYPAHLRARIAGRLGHLGNATAARILASCLHTGLRHVVAAHLSLENNTPALALAALAQVVGVRGEPQLHAAGASWGFDWIALD